MLRRPTPPTTQTDLPPQKWTAGYESSAASRRGQRMARKHHRPEEIVAKLRQVEVLTAQGKPVEEAVRAIGVTEATYYRWRFEYGGLKLDQVKRLKLLEQENGRLRKAVAELTVEKLILKEAASGNF
jgi:putative transposase